MAGELIRRVARLTWQLESPMIVSSGFGGLATDAVCVTDANGLPTIPGSSIAGVLRSLWPESTRDAVFGSLEAGGSTVRVSWACLHDAENRPVEGRLAADRITSDEVLMACRLGVRRDHVRLTHRGVAADRGKFDETLVPRGARFTFELGMDGGSDDDWNRLLALAASVTHVGGRTRMGLGALRLVANRHKSFDLRNPVDRTAFRRHPVSLAEPAPALKPREVSAAQEACELIVLELEPESFWMYGRGMAAEDGTDLNPVSEPVIVWSEGGRPRVENRFVLAATGIKGPIAHRTAFHYNALTGVFADKVENLSDHVGEKNRAVRELFGYVSGGGQQAGRIRIEDIDLGPVAGEGSRTRSVIQHVSIDRFTGGARRGFLFSEKPFYAGSAITVKIRILPGGKLDPTVRQALDLALKDLGDGALPLGGGASRGHGVFKRKVTT